jgi:hypothetical protein
MAYPNYIHLLASAFLAIQLTPLSVMAQGCEEKLRGRALLEPISNEILYYASFNDGPFNLCINQEPFQVCGAHKYARGGAEIVDRNGTPFPLEWLGSTNSETVCNLQESTAVEITTSKSIRKMTVPPGHQVIFRNDQRIVFSIKTPQF